MPKKKIEIKDKNSKSVDSKSSEKPVSTKTVTTPETLRGMKDILPQEARYWKWVENVVDNLARDYGFGFINPPILEHANLFIRAVGKQTDIVEKELFRFTDQGGEDIVLRPEATASIARAYINHGMLNQPQPVKLYYFGPMFRYDRPQAGRYREFNQFGFESLGDAKPIVDAEIILLAFNFLKELGIPVTIQINSIGSAQSRENYKQQLVNYYKPHRNKICEDCKKRLVKNPLRLLDCKVPSCVEIRGEAPQIVDHLDDESKEHFMKVLEYLDEVEVPYVLNPYLVRGLDYYNRTVFEIWTEGDEERSQNALGGGGRYDGLVETMGGRSTPAVGFAMGVERVILALKSRGIDLPTDNVATVFLAQLGDQAKRKAMAIFDTCRRAGIRITQSFAKDSLKAQLETANKLKVKFTLILGQKEVLDGTIIIREMDSGIQEIVDQRKIVAELTKKIELSLPKKIENDSI